MKTSTKLLIGLLTCIPLAITAYAYLLKQKFVANEFVLSIYAEEPEYSKVILDNYNHIVLDGELFYTGESALTRKPTSQVGSYKSISVSWYPTIKFKGDTDIRSFQILSEYQEALRTKIVKDTLFVSFVQDHGKKADYNSKHPLLVIDNQHLKSIKAQSSTIKISNFENKELSLDVSKAKLEIKKTDASTLTLIAGKESSVSMFQCNLDTLTYTILNRSQIDFENNHIKNYVKSDTDSTSFIAIRGHAENMTALLKQQRKN